MNLEVEIYLKNIIKFFKDNPKDLLNLIPKEIEQNFYDKIKIVAQKNTEEGMDAALTKKQLLDICVVLNKEYNSQVKVDDIIFQETKYGHICLN